MSVRKLVLAVSALAAAALSPFSPAAATNETLIPANATWSYNNSGVDLGTDWVNLTYNDSTWPQGPAEIGYGDGGEATVIGYGPDANNKYPTYYFRKNFTVNDTSAYTVGWVNVVRDDGAVVYVNGNEVYRTNMPAPPTNYTSLAVAAVGGADESKWFNWSFPVAFLANGTNVVAVEVHQNVNTSSDLSFNFKLDLTLSETNVTAYSSGTPTVPAQYVTAGTARCLGTIRFNGQGTVSAFNLTEYGTCDAAVDLANVKLFLDNGDGNWDPAADTTQLGNTTAFDGSNKASFSGLSISASSAPYVHIVTDINPSAADTSTIGVSIAQASDVVSTKPVSGAWPVQLGLSTVQSTMPTVVKYSAGTPAVPPAAIDGPASRVCFGTFLFNGTSTTIRGLNLTEYGTANATAGLENVTLFLDNGDGNWNSSQDTTQLGSAASFDASNKASFGGFNVTAGNTSYVHVVADVNDRLIKNNTIDIGIESSTDINATSGVSAAAWPLRLGNATYMYIYPYLQNPTTSSINVMWLTDSGMNSTVEYGLTSGYGSTVTDAGAATVHSMNLTGLSTNTTYHYRVRSGDMVTADATFRTAPASSDGFTFIAYGDSQGSYAGEGYNTLHESVANAAAAVATGTIVLKMGDQVYAESIDEWEPKFFLPGRNLWKSNAAYCARGNHEEGALLLQQYFNPPAIGGSGTKLYYSFNYGNTHFICLDPNQAHGVGSAQYNWLVSDLDSAAATGAAWTIVWFHQPGLSSNRIDAVVASDLMPLFETKGVDLVMNGHDHYYERSYKNGVYYVITAGGGNGLVDVTGGGDSSYVEVHQKTLHFCKLRVDADKITLQAYNPAGTVFDSFVIPRATTVTKYESGTPVVPAATVGTNTVGNCFGTLQLGSAGFVTGINLTGYGTANASASLANVKLFLDNGDGNWSAAQDTSQLGSTTSFNASSKASFSGFNVTANSTVYVHIVADTTSSLAENSTIGVSVQQASDVISSVSLSGSYPVQLGLSTAQGMVSIEPFAGGTPAAPPATVNGTGVVCLGTMLFNGTGGNLSGVNLTQYGTCNATAGLSNVSLYLDNGDGSWNASQDTVRLGSAGTFDASNKVSFGGFSIAASNSTYVHVVAYANDNLLKNQTISVGIASAADVNATRTPDVAGWPVQFGNSTYMSVYPYLQNPTTSSINIMWITDSGMNSTVEYGVTSGYGSTVTDASSATVHSMNLTGLSANTTYHYRVSSNGITSVDGIFKTAPPAGSGFTFLAYGDTRASSGGPNYSTEHAKVTRIMEQHDPGTIVLNVGDMAYSGQQNEYEPMLFWPARNLYRNDAVYISRGNHEGDGVWYQNYFNPPSAGSGSELYYSFNYGNVHFIALDNYSDYSVGSAQYTWLVNDLDSAAATSAAWIVVFFHQPGFSTHRQDAGVQATLLPLFETKGVDLVFNGHDHFYERHYKDGVQYIITGGGGAPLYDSSGSGIATYREYYRKTLEFCSIQVTDTRMTVTAYDDAGTAFDTVVIPRSLLLSKHAGGSPVVPPATVSAGSTGNCLGTFAFTSSGYFTGVNLTEYGSANATAVLSNVKLFLDNGDGNWSAADDTTQLGAAASFDASSFAAFSGFNVTAGPATYVHVVSDVTGAASPATTIGVEVAQASDVAASATVSAASWPVQLGLTSTSGGSIATPQAGRVVGPNPTVTGTATAGASIEVRDELGNTIGTGTADPAGNYRVETTTALSSGSHTLTVYVDGVAKASSAITVTATPTASQQPVITSPVDGAKVYGHRPVIQGNAAASAAVVITALDASGNLVTVGSGTAGADGSFSVTCSVDLPAGANKLTVTCNGVTSAVIDVSFVDPFGVVFDSASNQPIAGAQVTIFYDNDPGAGRSWIQAVPGVHIAPGDVNPQTTDATGQYNFLTINGDFYISITAPGYSYPSQKSTFPAGRTVITGSKGEPFTVAGAVIEMDHPMDPAATLLRVRKDANKKEVSVGDVVTYSVEIENPTSGAVAGVYVDDKIPAGFKYLKGKTVLDHAGSADPTGTTLLTFNVGTIPAATKRTLKYQLVVGSGVGFGKYENHAYAKYADGSVISNVADKSVKVVADPTFDLGTIIGKVFYDDNANGIQDKGEEPVPFVTIGMEDGTVITTDREGKYHVAGVTPGRHLLKVDTSTLPAGCALTTDERVVVDITSGIMAKANFGVVGPHAAEGAQQLSQVEKAKPQPLLNVSIYKDRVEYRDGVPVEKPVFRIFTNYGLYLKAWRIDIKDKDTGALVRTFSGSGKDMEKPVVWDGLDAYGMPLDPRRNYAYSLTVTGAEGGQDRTREKSLQAVEKGDAGAWEDDLLDVGSFASQAGERKQYFDQQRKANALAVQNIPVQGEMVTVRGVEGASSVTVRSRAGGAMDVPASGQEAQVIVPPGEYEVVSDGRSRQVSVGKDELFFVAMGDAKAGYNMHKGSIEPVKPDDRFKKGFWNEGRLAYYLKGKIKGKYLVTSSLDTDRARKELFKSIDPNKYYPVYGDGSSVNYAASDTQGPLYLLVEWDKSSAIWGNYHAAVTDTEFAQFNRTLYGGKVAYQSVEDTKFQEPRTKALVFRATAKQRASHNEFLGTGGSLYYLKNRDVIDGSDKVKIEVRDRVTGLVLATHPVAAGEDYEIDYTQGRLTFTRPVAMLAASDSLISSRIAAGNPVYVVADYEYEVKDKVDEATTGARFRQAFTDYATFGATYIQDAQLNKNYTLKGSDTTLHLGDSTKVSAEYAESESAGAGNYVSTDGGLRFSDLTTGNAEKGKAYGVKMESQLLSDLGFKGYYKLVEKGFSSASTLAQQGKESMGAEAVWDMDSRTRVKARHDIQKLKDDANLQAQSQVGARKAATSSVQATRQVNDRLAVSAEVVHQEVSGKIEPYESEPNKQGSVAAVAAEYRASETLKLFLQQQEQLKGVADHRTTVGADKKLSQDVSVRARQTVGNRGTATSVGASAKVRKKVEVSTDYTHEAYTTSGLSDTAAVSARAKADSRTDVSTTYAITDSSYYGKTQSVAVGSRRKINDELAMKTDRTFASGGDAMMQASTYGLEREQGDLSQELSYTNRREDRSYENSRSNIMSFSGGLADRLSGTVSFEKGIVQNLDGTRINRYAGSLGGQYLVNDPRTKDRTFKATGKLELRSDRGDENARQYLASTSLEKRVTRDHTVFTKVNVSSSRDTTNRNTLAQYREFVTGVSYRPVDFDRLNFLGKYTYLLNDNPSGQEDFGSVLSERSQVWAVEGVYDLTAQWQWVEKAAFKHGKEQVADFGYTKTFTWLMVHRLNYCFDKKWKFGLEYRRLAQRQAKDSKQGALAEISRKIDKYIDLGIGYNFTDFNDDLAHLDYTSQGPFVRITGGF